MIELLPCPFCGSAAKHITDPQNLVECGNSNCGCVSQNYECFGIPIETWNKRVSRTFKYKPLQFVWIIVFDLHFKGRVTRCILDNQTTIYEVEYAADGEIRRREFLEDEISEL